MRKYITSLLILFSLNLTHAQTQMQNARVKTRGRMVDGQYIPGKGLPGTVVSIEGITDIGVRNSNGTFSFPVEDNNYYVKSVAKNEYALLDSDAAPKFYNYSEDTLYFVMEQPEQMFENLLETKDKIRKTLEREWRKAMEEIKRLKEENKMSQEEYLRQYELLISSHEKKEDLVSEMAKRYSAMDFDQLDEFYREVTYCIEQGELQKADSLLRTKGNLTEQIEAYLNKKEELRQEKEKLEQAKAVLAHDNEELAQRCYSYFEMFKMQYQYDSAAFYIEQRARIDTLNPEWQFDAGLYFYQQRKYNIAETYMRRPLRLFLDLMKSDALYVEQVVIALHDLAVIYVKTRRYSEAEQMYVKSLDIRRELSKDNPQVYEPYVAMSLNNLAVLYHETHRYSEAEQMYVESLEINRKLAEDTPQVYEPDVAENLSNLAALYVITHRYSEAEQMFVESLDIRRKLSKDNPQVYEPYVAITLNGLATLYVETHRYSEAERMYKESLEINRKLSEDNPQVYESDVAMTLNGLAALYVETYRYSEAERIFKESLETYRKLSEDNPQVYERDVAMTLYRLASLYNRTCRYSNPELVERIFKESLGICRKLLKDNPQVYGYDVAGILYKLVNLYKDTQRYSEAEQICVESLETYRKLSEDNPENYGPCILIILKELKSLCITRGDIANAVIFAEEEVLHCRNLACVNNIYHEDYIISLLHLVVLYMETNEILKQYEINKELLPLLKNEYNKSPEQYCQFYTNVLGNHSLCCMFNKEFSKAEQYAREGLEVDPTQTSIYTKLASSLLLQGKYKEAEKIYKKYKSELKESFLSDFEQFETEGIIPEIYQSDVEKIKQLLNE